MADNVNEVNCEETDPSPDGRKRIDTYRANGEKVVLNVRTDYRKSKSRLGPHSSPGALSATTMAGESVEYVDEQTFEIEHSGEVLTRIPPQQKNQ